MALDLTGLGSVADLASNVISKIWPDKTEQERAQLAAALAIVQGQLEINRVEAANPSLLTSGWRPFIGWVCGAACAWNWIGLPVAMFTARAVGHPLDMSGADLSEIMPLMFGMLGLGSLRTYEKVKGVSSSNRQTRLQKLLVGSSETRQRVKL